MKNIKDPELRKSKESLLDEICEAYEMELGIFDMPYEKCVHGRLRKYIESIPDIFWDKYPDIVNLMVLKKGYLFLGSNDMAEKVSSKAKKILRSLSPNEVKELNALLDNLRG